ncbi:MAG: T9SS type A sorting domain-containing protein [Taibaiella sp.]
MAQGTGSVETAGGTAGFSVVSMAASDTNTSIAESLYIGPGNYQIDGTWNIYSKNVWISPEAIITGTGTIKFFNPSDAGGVSGPTLIDGNSSSAFINVNIELHNASNLILTDLAGPGAPWVDAIGPANLAIGGAFTFAVANGDVLLGNHDMITATAATLNNYQPDRFVVTNGTGHLVHNNYTGTFTYPVGIEEGDYTPASIDNTVANTIHVMVQDYTTSASVESGTDGINRTWNIYADNATANSLVDLQHNMATNNASYNDAISFVTQYSATAPNTTGQTTLSQSNWQSNNPGAGSGTGTLTTGTTMATASERNLTYTTLATTASAPEASFTKSSNPITPLPLDLTSFTGKAINCSALLSWTTAEESGMSHFDLQKSIDGNAFKQVARIAVKGSNSQYAYTDKEVTTVEHYYRLRIVSLDEKETYSNVLALNIDCHSSQDITVYPNPFNDRITVQGTNIGNELSITDITGRTMATVIADNILQHIDMSSYPSGVYLLRIIQNDASVKTVKMVKQ